MLEQVCCSHTPIRQSFFTTLHQYLVPACMLTYVSCAFVMKLLCPLCDCVLCAFVMKWLCPLCDCVLCAFVMKWLCQLSWNDCVLCHEMDVSFVPLLMFWSYYIIHNLFHKCFFFTFPIDVGFSYTRLCSDWRLLPMHWWWAHHEKITLHLQVAIYKSCVGNLTRNNIGDLKI